MKNKLMIGTLLFFTTISTILVVLSLQITPLQLKRDTFTYEYGEDDISTNVADYINANEKVISEAQLNFTEVKNAVGVYPASITYMGEEYKFYIKVVDTTKPVVKLKQVQFNISVGTTLDAMNLIESVEDSSEVVAYFESDDGEKVTSKSFEEVGSYVENIVVYDSSDNQSAKLRVKIVVGNQGASPIFKGIEEIEIKKGSSFDPLKGVSATDGNDRDITNNIVIMKDNVDADKVGIYEVIYKVTGSNGNSTQRSRKVVVVK